MSEEPIPWHNLPKELLDNKHFFADRSGMLEYRYAVSGHLTDHLDHQACPTCNNSMSVELIKRRDKISIVKYCHTCYVTTDKDIKCMTLGEEADIARCEICNKEQAIDIGVCCEACGGFFCRRYCWPDHWCGPLTDRNGRIVKMGDRLQYHDNPKKTWEVTEMLPSYRRYAMCKGVNIKDSNRVEIPLHTRLMTIL